MTNREEIYNYYKSKFNKLYIDDESFIRKYSSVADEYNLIKNGVALRDLSNYSKIFIHGENCEDLLRKLATNKIYDLKVLEWVKTLFINIDGNIIDRTLLFKFEDYFLLIGSNPNNKKLYKWIKKFISDGDISLQNSFDNYSLFEIMGSQASSYMAMILEDEFNESKKRSILRVKMDDFFLHCIKLKDVGNIEKYVILVDPRNTIRMLEIFNERKSVFDFGMVGEDAYNIFRIENGIPVAPNELNNRVNPKEVNLLNEVCPVKDDFIGCRAIENSSNELGKLVGIKFEKNFNISNENLLIEDDLGKNIGIITSLVNHEHLEHPIGLGFIKADILPNGEFYFTANENMKSKMKSKIKISDL